MPLQQDHDRDERGQAMSDKDQLDRIERRLEGIETQLAYLIDALAQDDEDEAPAMDLQGNQIPPRDKTLTTF